MAEPAPMEEVHSEPELKASGKDSPDQEPGTYFSQADLIKVFRAWDEPSLRENMLLVMKDIKAITDAVYGNKFSLVEPGLKACSTLISDLQHIEDKFPAKDEHPELVKIISDNLQYAITCKKDILDRKQSLENRENEIQARREKTAAEFEEKKRRG